MGLKIFSVVIFIHFLYPEGLNKSDHCQTWNCNSTEIRTSEQFHLDLSEDKALAQQSSGSSSLSVLFALPCDGDPLHKPGPNTIPCRSRADPPGISQAKLHWCHANEKRLWSSVCFRQPSDQSAEASRELPPRNGQKERG